MERATADIAGENIAAEAAPVGDAHATPAASAGKRDMDLAMLAGFALFQMWVTLCFFTPQLFPTQQTSMWHIYEVSLAVSALALIPCAILHAKAAPILRGKPARWALAACAAAGTALIPCSLFTTGAVAAALATIAALLTGMASGLLNLAWCQEFAERGAATDFVLSVVVSSIAIYVLTNLAYSPSVSPRVMLVASVLVPIASCILLTRPRPATSGFGQLPIPVDVRSRRSFIVRLCVGIFVISFADEFMRNFYLNDTDLAFYSSQVNFVLLVLKIIVSALVVTSIRGKRREDFSFLYRASFLLALVSALFLPYAQESANIAYGITNCGAFLFKLTVLLVSLELCARHEISAVLVFAIVRAVWSLDLLLGSVLYTANAPQFAAGADVGPLAVALAILVAIAYLFVFTPGTSNGSFGGVSLSSLLRRGTSQPEAAGDAPGPAPGNGAAPGPDLDEVCDELARRHSLSGRETDVLRLLARGRTTTRIEAELGISTNTVNTHVRHVFQKLDVHSRQELLDAVEAQAQEVATGTGSDPDQRRDPERDAGLAEEQAAR